MTKKTKKLTEIALLKSVQKLGHSNQLLKVNSGYARNYLIPNKLGKLKTLIMNMEELNNKEMKNFELACAHKKILEEIEKFSVEKAAGKEDKLFGTVSNKSIIDAIKKVNFLEKIEVLPIKIKKLGTYSVSIILSPKVVAKIKLEVLPK